MLEKFTLKICKSHQTRIGNIGSILGHNRSNSKWKEMVSSSPAITVYELGQYALSGCCLLCWTGLNWFMGCLVGATIKMHHTLPRLKSIHWVNISARSSFFEKHIILTKPFQPARADISCSFFEKHIIVQNFLVSEWALVPVFTYYFIARSQKLGQIFVTY